MFKVVTRLIKEVAAQLMMVEDKARPFIRLKSPLVKILPNTDGERLPETFNFFDGK